MPKKVISKKSIVTGIITKYCIIYGIGFKELSDISGMTIDTFYRRLRDPSMFRIRELTAISDELHIPMEERMQMILGDIKGGNKNAE